MGWACNCTIPDAPLPALRKAGGRRAQNMPSGHVAPREPPSSALPPSRLSAFFKGASTRRWTSDQTATERAASHSWECRGGRTVSSHPPAKQPVQKQAPAMELTECQTWTLPHPPQLRRGAFKVSLRIAAKLTQCLQAFPRGDGGDAVRRLKRRDQCCSSTSRLPPSQIRQPPRRPPVSCVYVILPNSKPIKQTRAVLSARVCPGAQPNAHSSS